MSDLASMKEAFIYRTALSCMDEASFTYIFPCPLFLFNKHKGKNIFEF